MSGKKPFWGRGYFKWDGAFPRAAEGGDNDREQGPDAVSLAEHSRIVGRAVDEALLARDRLWLKKLKTVEILVQWPWQGPVTTLIRTTEREIEEKARKLEPQSPSP